MVRISKYGYSTATPIAKTETHGKSLGKHKRRLTFKDFENDESMKVHFLSGGPRKLGLINSRRYVLLNVSHPRGNESGIFININSLAKRLNIKAADIRQAYKDGSLEKLLDEKLSDRLAEKEGNFKASSEKTNVKKREKKGPFRRSAKISSSSTRKSKIDETLIPKTKPKSSSKQKSKGISQRVKETFTSKKKTKKSEKPKSSKSEKQETTTQRPRAPGYMRPERGLKDY